MTTPEKPGTPTAAAVAALRPLFVWAMLGYVALSLFFQLFAWLLLDGTTFASRSYQANFAQLGTITLPLAAVLLASAVRPVLSYGKLVAVIALGLYAATFLLDGVTFLIGLGVAFTHVDTLSEAMGAFGHVVLHLFDLLWVALAVLGVIKVYTALGGKLPAPSLTA